MTEATTIGAAVARTEAPTPAALVKQYSQDFIAVLPSHIRADSWVRIAQGALKTGKKSNGKQFDLEVAAANNIGAFMQALSVAARLGLTPGSEEFYLVPRKVKGRAEIQGIVGYQGIVELIYRAGAVSSVIAENVYAKDGFTYRPGQDERPIHDVDWDSEDRGPLRLVYAYAIMKDGATSKVVVLNKSQILKVRAKSDSAHSEYSPWNTNEDSMWLKSAVRQLRKWVPTSSEYITTQIKAVRAADEPVVVPDVSHMTEAPFPDEGDDLDVIDGEVVQ